VSGRRRSATPSRRVSAFPLGAIYACDDCQRVGTANPRTFDAIQAAYHRRRTGHTLTAILEVRDVPRD